MQSSRNPGDLVSQTTGSSLGLNCGEHVPPQNTESTLDLNLGDMDPLDEDSTLVLGPGALIQSPSSVYQLDSLLGSGVYGHVVLCRNLTADRMVALKMFRDPELQDDGFHEMSLLQMLAERGAHNHHIVRWFSSFEFFSHFCHEFEELDISLKELLEDSPSERLTLREIRPIVFQMARALLFLKRVGVMHCDLKPDNIMMIHHVQQPLRIKIIDFGIGCLTTTDTQGVLMQTICYRAPEVVLGAPVQEAIDMWSVGCIAAEMFLGAILFEVKDEEDLVKHIVERVGHPPTTCLDQGLYTSLFYQCCPLTHQWQFKLSSLDPAPHMIKDLYDIKTRGSTGDSTEDHDHFVFMDLVKSMLDVDPETRHTPEQVLKHPFIRMSHLAKRDSAYLAQSRRNMYQAYGRVPNRQRGNPSSSVSSALPTESPPTTTTSQGQTLKGKCEEQVCQEIRDTSSPAKSRTSSQSPQVPPGFCPLPVHRSAPETNGSTTQGHS